MAEQPDSTVSFGASSAQGEDRLTVEDTASLALALPEVTEGQRRGTRRRGQYSEGRGVVPFEA